MQYVEELDLLYNSFAITKKIYEFYNSSLLFKKPSENCNEIGLNWATGLKFFK